MDETEPDLGKKESAFPWEEEGASPANTGATGIFERVEAGGDRQRKPQDAQATTGGRQSDSSSSGPGIGAAAGFTELIRSLQPEPAQPSAPVREPAAPPVKGNADRDASFTMLLKTLDSAVPPARQPNITPLEANREPAFREPPMRQDGPRPQTSASDGFTALLGSLSNSGEFKAGSTATPDAERVSSPAPMSGAKPPGEFTRLLSSFEETRSKPDLESIHARPASAQAEPGSLTKFFSGGSANSSFAPADPFLSGASGREPGFGPAPSYQSTGTGMSTPMYSEPAPAPAAEPPGDRGMGMTALFRKLDEQAEAPRSAPSGGYTNQFAVAAPLAASPPAGFPSEPATPSSSGSSEVTRIFEASRVREMELRSAQAASGGQPHTPATPAPPAAAPPAMPQFQMPAYPQAPMMPPQTPPYGHPQMPPYGQPQMPPMGGGGQMSYGGAPGMPMMPAMQMPPVQAPAPAPPPAPAQAAAPLGKMQQFVPLLLLLIVFLLVGLIVTVVFLLKK